MRKYALIAALAVLPAKTVLATEYTVDSSHTYVSFAVSHLGFSTMRGQFDQQTGSLQFDPAAKKASVKIEIDAASIDTGHDKRDSHLRSPDFLNAVEYPTISFESTGVTWNGEQPATVTGNLTLLGVSKPVTLTIKSMKCGTNPINRKETCGFDATGSIKRTDFGVNYGVPAIGEALDLQIEFEATRNDDKNLS